MTPYANLRGNSPVLGYLIEPTRICVMFKNGKIYSYSYASAGVDKVEQMKILAQSGTGVKCLHYKECSL